MLDRSWVGQRVSVRRAVRRPDGNGIAFSDVVGDLVALDADHAIVDSRGGLVEVAVAHVAAAKLVPPSTRDELDLQAVIDAGWVAREREQLGGWTLRANDGFTSRANSVLALAPVGMPMDDALDAAIRWYTARNLAPRFQLAVEGRRLLDAELGERGWAPSEDVHVMTRRLSPPSGAAPEGVTAAGTPSDDFFGVYRAGAAPAPQARELLLRHRDVAFAEVRSGAELVAIGRATVDGDWLGVSAVEVVPAARRRGHAVAVMAALAEWGATRGAARVHLEVSAGNAAALELYGRLGFRVHHDYRYRTAPGS